MSMGFDDSSIDRVSDIDFKAINQYLNNVDVAFSYLRTKWPIKVWHVRKRIHWKGETIIVSYCDAGRLRYNNRNAVMCFVQC